MGSLSRSHLTTITLIILIGIALAFAIRAIIHQSEVATRVSCQGNLTCISIAMHQYHEKYGHFPPAFRTNSAGVPTHSWRALLLEFLDFSTFQRYSFDEPWDGPNNRQLESMRPNCFACPADGLTKDNYQTNYFVVVGPNTVFPGSQTTQFDDIRWRRDQTILVVEAVGQQIHWMEPKDLSFDSLEVQLGSPTDPTSGISSYHRDGPYVCMVEGSKQQLSVGISPADVYKWLTIAE